MYNVCLRLIHTGQFFNGLGGPVLMGGCPVVSAQWFPEYQRTTATALGSGLGVLGYAVSFLLGKRVFAVATTSACSETQR